MKDTKQMTKFIRGSYGSVSFKRTGCDVTVFLPENESQGWCLRIGRNIYAGFATRRQAIEAVGRYI
jgi:hypothetical protein